MIIEGGSEQSLTSSKADLRSAFKAAIAAIEPSERRAQENALIARYSGLPGLARATNLLLFVSALPEEPPTFQLFSLAISMKKTVLCPRVHRRARRLSLHRIADPASELCRGALGIPEPRAGLPEVPPAEVDWALVPGLAFDERGFRLGRGAGYYDRLLPLLRPDAICWAVCLSCQLVDRLPVEPHDAPLHGVSTPGRDVRGTRATQSF
jgi:5-formyltetrahydrofolate cyclo-ligase